MDDENQQQRGRGRGRAMLCVRSFPNKQRWHVFRAMKAWKHAFNVFLFRCVVCFASILVLFCFVAVCSIRMIRKSAQTNNDVTAVWKKKRAKEKWREGEEKKKGEQIKIEQSEITSDSIWGRNRLHVIISICDRNMYRLHVMLLLMHGAPCSCQVDRRIICLQSYSRSPITHLRFQLIAV